MKGKLNFLIEISKLKKVPRTGWVLMKVRNPETIINHIFRLAMDVWLLGEKKKLDLKKLIKIAIAHDLCEVYAGDVTPFFYYVQLPAKKGRRKLIMKWVRLSKSEKEKLGKKKFEKEKNSLLKVIEPLKPELKKEIFSSWFEFEKRITREGKFAKQVDRIETLIQSIEYFGKKEDISGTGWWEGTEELVDDPLLLEFLKVIQKKFYGRPLSVYRIKKELENILDFILEIGKLKRLPRRIWSLLGIKDPETVAAHIVSVSLMAWVFGQERKDLNMEKLLKMALCHEIPAIYTQDLTPYDRILPKDKKGRKEIFKKWLRLPKKTKEKIFLADYKDEKRALKKLTSKLKPSLRKEIIQLFDEYKTSSSPEARFLNQVNVLAVLIQGLQYKKKNKKLSINWLWEWVFEKCDNLVIFEFIEELKKKFIN